VQVEEDRIEFVASRHHKHASFPGYYGLGSGVVLMCLRHSLPK
jgi:hypothetical protein